MRTPVVLKSIIEESKDGEWGKDEPFHDSVKMRVIRGTDFEKVRKGEIGDLPIRYIPKHIAERKSLKPNDILLETAGGSKDRPTGRSLLIKSSTIYSSQTKFTCASFSRFIRINPAKADPCYIFWHLQYLYNYGYLLQYHTQHTGVARFQYTVFSENERLFIPHISTQQKIASILSAYDDLIENNTRRIKILEEMAQTLYHEWFVKFRFPGHEQVKMVESELGLIPEGWVIDKLSNLAFINQSTIKTNNAPEEINYIDISSVSTGVINKIDCILFSNSSSRARRIVKHGDIIWSTVRPNRKSYSIILNPQNNLIVSTGFAVITANKIPYTYLYYAVTTDDFVGYLTNNATGSAYPAVNSNDFKNADVLVPDKKILDSFHSFVEPLLIQKHNLQTKNKNLQKTRDLLLPKLISGEIDVENLNIDTLDIAA